MSKIVGNVVGIPNPQSDFNQNDSTKADYIKNKPTTVSGYGIKDVYTKTEVDEQIKKNISGNVNLDNPQFTGKLSIDDAEIYRELDKEGNPTGCLILSLPWHGNASPPIKIKIGEDKLSYIDSEDVEFNFYHTGNLLDLTKLDNKLGDVDKNIFMDNVGLSEEVETKKVSVAGTEIYINERGEFVIYAPTKFDENGIPINAEGRLIFSGDMAFINDNEVYHRGNLINLAEVNNFLDGDQRDIFMYNTGLNVIIGDTDTAIDEILEIQDAYINGDIGNLPMWTGGSY